jgi:hypothetical protein
MTALDDMDDDSNPQQQPYSSPIQEVQANELIASLDHVDLAGEKQLDLCFVLDSEQSSFLASLAACFGGGWWS